MAFDRRETALLLIGDFLLLIISLIVALFLRNLSLPPLGFFITNLVPFLPMFCIFLATFYIAGLYEKQTRPIRSVMGLRVFGAQLANITIAAILFFTLPLTIEPKTILVLFLVVSVITISLWRFYRMKHEIDSSERMPAFLVGKGRAVDELHDEINASGWYRIYFVGRAESYEVAQIPKEVKVIVVDTYAPMIAKTLSTLYLRPSTITILEFATLYEEIFDRVPLEHIGIESVVESLQRRHTTYDLAKRLFDLVLAGVGVVFVLPFIIFGVLGRVVTRTPIFFPHIRIGTGGKSFTLLKLSSMLLNDHGDPELQKKNYVTSFGKFLRKTRIDELPQLWNVLKGDLSFIGPRPELPKIAEVYEREIPYYSFRHMVTPGLSGWAQIHDFDAPRGGADVERTKRKLSFDLYYLKHRSLGLDLAIAVKTLRALFSFTGV